MRWTFQMRPDQEPIIAGTVIPAEQNASRVLDGDRQPKARPMIAPDPRDEQREKDMTTTFNAAATKTIRVNGTNFVYREIGDKSGIPVVFLHHLTAVLEDWDPAIADGLAKSRPVIVFDNRGVGGSEGRTPDTVADMANDAMAFIDALGFTKVDLFGFSLGGFIARAIAQDRFDLVHRMILAGTTPAGGEGIGNAGALLQDAIRKGRRPEQASKASPLLPAVEKQPKGGRRIPQPLK
ncbi:MAG TPA: alpha/beta hydrolase [Xanthobacteraceae bacterium]